MGNWPLVVIVGVVFLACATMHFADRREKTAPKQLDDPLVRAATCIESLYEGTIGAVSSFVMIALLGYADTAIKGLPKWAENPAQGFASCAILAFGTMYLGSRPRKAGDFATIAVGVAVFGVCGAIISTVAGASASSVFHYLRSMD
jgi:hypothetical protein